MRTTVYVSSLSRRPVTTLPSLVTARTERFSGSIEPLGSSNCCERRTKVKVAPPINNGQAQAKRLFPHATVTYFPFDFSWSVRRFLDHYKPRVFATMETEIWPNVTRLARARGMRLILANGRLSDRSFPRYRAFRLKVGEQRKAQAAVPGERSVAPDAVH